MVEVSLSGADATWLDDDERRLLRERIRTEAEALQRAVGPAEPGKREGRPEAPLSPPPPDA
jgi:hypothetical protein